MVIHISKRIKSDFKGLFTCSISGIVFLNEEIVFFEFKESVDFFLLFSVLFGMHDNPLFKSKIDLGLISG